MLKQKNRGMSCPQPNPPEIIQCSFLFSLSYCLFPAHGQGVKANIRRPEAIFSSADDFGSHAGARGKFEGSIVQIRQAALICIRLNQEQRHLGAVFEFVGYAAEKQIA
jgi:hypothetical protein